MREAKLFLSTVLVAGVLSLTASITLADETYYRWLDERGNPVHSDRPPPKGVDYEVISTGSSLKRQVDAKEGSVPLDLEPKPGNEFEQVDTAPPEVEKNPEYCKRAKDNLATLERDIRIRMRNDNGEYYYLTEEQKAEQKKAAEAAIATHCE